MSNLPKAVPDLETLSLPIDIRSQPDETTCGPTCLDAVYRYYGDALPLERVISETGRLAGGGTLAVFLASHALSRGYRATIYTYNLQIFDPSWFDAETTGPPVDLIDRLRRQKTYKRSTKLHVAIDAYLDYLQQGGRVRFEDLTPALVRRHLKRDVPILTGLSATYLYRTPREHENLYDDVRGEPSGHFVVLCGYDVGSHEVRVADPYLRNPFRGQYYPVAMHRLIGAIYLGVLTYDANLLVLEPRRPRADRD
jgi:hypothetical protein